jgi:hypothetical protein
MHKRTKLSALLAVGVFTTTLLLTGCSTIPAVPTASSTTKALSSSPSSANVELAPEAKTVISEAISAPTPTPVLAPVTVPNVEVVTPAPTVLIEPAPAQIVANPEPTLSETPVIAPPAPVAKIKVAAPQPISSAPVAKVEAPVPAVAETTPEVAPGTPQAEPEAVEAPVATVPSKPAPEAVIAPEAPKVDVVETPIAEAPALEENKATPDEELVEVTPTPESTVGEAISISAPDALVTCEFAGYLFSESVTPEDCMSIFAAYEDAVANAELYRTIGSAHSDSASDGVVKSFYNNFTINSGKSDTTTINTRSVLDQVISDINAANDAKVSS